MLRKLSQAAKLIKEWALETKHRVAGEHMLSAIDQELYASGLDDQGSGVLPALDELRKTPGESDPPLGKAAKLAYEGVLLVRAEWVRIPAISVLKKQLPDPISYRKDFQ